MKVSFEKEKDSKVKIPETSPKFLSVLASLLCTYSTLLDPSKINFLLGEFCISVMVKEKQNIIEMYALLQ